MAFADEYPGLDYVLTEFFEAAGDFKKHAADGIDIDDIVSSIPDPAVREYVRKMLAALSKLPSEVESVVKGGPWKMMNVFQALAARAMSLFK